MVHQVPPEETELPGIMGLCWESWHPHQDKPSGENLRRTEWYTRNPVDVWFRRALAPSRPSHFHITPRRRFESSTLFKTPGNPGIGSKVSQEGKHLFCSADQAKPLWRAGLLQEGTLDWMFKDLDFRPDSVTYQPLWGFLGEMILFIHSFVHLLIYSFSQAINIYWAPMHASNFKDTKNPLCSQGIHSLIWKMGKPTIYYHIAMGGAGESMVLGA